MKEAYGVRVQGLKVQVVCGLGCRFTGVRCFGSRYECEGLGFRGF